METPREAAQRYVARGERMRNQLELIVSELRRVGHDSAVAEGMLRATRALLIKMHTDMARLDGAAAQEGQHFHSRFSLS